jgi:cytidine deaminase
MKTSTIEIKYSIFANAEELPSADRTLLEAAKTASFSAYAPYSQFRVGAAVLLSTGEMVLGNNQENISYPAGLCAERVAVFAAMAQYPKGQIKALAVYANPMDCESEHFVTPCGACRQVLAECEQRNKGNIRILCGGKAGEVLAVDSVNDLLPLGFKM